MRNTIVILLCVAALCCHAQQPQSKILSPILGLYAYDVNQSFRSKYIGIKPGFALGIHVGLGLHFKKEWEISARRTIDFNIIAREPRFTISGWSTETLLGVNKRFLHRNKFYVRTGIDALVSTKPSLGSRKYNRYGIAPFVAIPIDWLEIEFRAHWTLYPDGAMILDVNRYRLFVTYRF